MVRASTPILITKHLLDDYIFPVMNCSYRQNLTLDDLAEQVLTRIHLLTILTGKAG